MGQSLRQHRISMVWSPPNVHRWSMLRRGTRRGWWRLWRTWTIFGCLSILLKAGMFIIDAMCIHRAYIYFPSIGVLKISLPAMKGRSSPEPLPLKRPARRCVSNERSGSAMPCNHSTSWIPRTTWNTHFYKKRILKLYASQLYVSLDLKTKQW